MTDPKYRESEPVDGPTTQRWLRENPQEIPHEWEDEAASMGLDTSEPGARDMIRELLEMDPDIMGDWDRYQ